jgi:hypothetical protein
MHVTITAVVVPGRLDIEASLSGDGFPNAELIVQDEQGNRQMLFTFETTGGPDTGPLSLIGDSKRWMNGVSKSFRLVDPGVFVGSSFECTAGPELR